MELPATPTESSAPPAPPTAAGNLVEPWSTEGPLRFFVILASLGIWAMLAISIFGIVYAAFIGLFLFFSHVAFITHVRGSAIRLGPKQFPQLWARVVELSRRAGLPEPPEAYLMEAGGSLNAFATKFLGGKMIVLFSDLLEACGDDTAARDMVIGHEIGHLKSGHLDWWWLTAPGRLMPFLGSAYSRACEYTCDRWGAALCGERGGATRGLTILAAGRVHASQVNVEAFVAQQEHLDTGWMTIGAWLSGYPPLSARIAAIEPTFASAYQPSGRGPLRAVGILGAVFVIPTALMVGGAVLWGVLIAPKLLAAAGGGLGDSSFEEYSSTLTEEEPFTVTDVPAAILKAETELGTIAAVLREHHAATGVVVPDEESLEALWPIYRAGEPYPNADPFDGLSYGYNLDEDGNGINLFSSGPDGSPSTEDDIRVEVRFGGEGGTGD